MHIIESSYVLYSRQPRVDGKQFIHGFPDMVMNGNERACESRAEVQ